MKNLLSILVLTALVLMGACSQEPKTNRGFSLPEGDIEIGRKVFLELQCNACHTVANTDLSHKDWVFDGTRELEVRLGGPKSKVQTYADLVTSIINPSHRISKNYPLNQVAEVGQSKMRNYNNIMRVDDLVNIVTFLKTKYSLREAPMTTYPFYIYPG